MQLGSPNNLLIFGKSKATISEHIKHIFEEGELDEKAVVRNFRTTTPHGAIENKEQVGYNLSPCYNNRTRWQKEV